jgi:lipoprotein-anchoring transpeptidase ErfK/SrfK
MTLSNLRRTVPAPRPATPITTPQMIRNTLTPGCLALVLLALSACSETSNAARPVVETTAVTTSTTVVPDTTAASTTTSSTTSTTSTTTSTLPANVEVVGPAPVPIAAVGTADGEPTRVLQERLNQLGFWTGEADGLYGKATSQAVMAFQKYHRLPTTGEVDPATAALITGVEERGRGSSDNGTLVEVDKTKQLLFLIVNGKTLWTFNTSTGSEIPYEAVNQKQPWKVERGDSVTPNGLWVVDRQRTDGWWEGDLGKIYRPKYFRGGVAVHGMTSIPDYPASHGCVRVSVPAMDFIWSLDLVNLGTPVWVHGAWVDPAA